MSRTFGLLKGTAMATAMAIIVIVLVSTLAPMGGSLGIIGKAKADTSVFQSPVSRGNFTLPSPTPTPLPSLSAGRQITIATPTPIQPGLSINYSGFKFKNNFTYKPVNNTSTSTSAVGWVYFDALGYTMPEDGILKINVTRNGGLGVETFKVIAIDGTATASEVGWTNVTSTLSAPGSVEISLPINASSGKGLAGKYLVLKLVCLAELCRDLAEHGDRYHPR